MRTRCDNCKNEPVQCAECWRKDTFGLVPRRPGRTPDIMRKGGPMKDRSKYNRKPKHKRRDHDS